MAEREYETYLMFKTSMDTREQSILIFSYVNRAY